MRKVLLVALVLVAVASVLYAQERIRVKSRIQKEFDENRDGWLDGEEQEALERFMRKRREKEGHGELEEVKERIHELLKAAKEAKRAGNHDKAEKLLRKAEELKRKFHGKHREKPAERGGPSPEEIERMKRAIGELLDRAEKAEREGRLEEALELVEKAEVLEKELTKMLKRGVKEKPKTEPFPPEIMEKIEQAKREIEKLHRMAAQAKEDGNHDRAHELLEKAERIEREVREQIERFRREHHGEREGEREHHHPEKIEWVEKAKREVEELREAAHEAKERGHHDKARELWREAEALERKIAEMIEKHARHEKPGLPPELEKKAARMKEEIERLRDKAHEAKERGDHDRAEDLWRESEKLEEKLKEMLKPHHGEEPEHAREAEIEEIERHIEKLERLADEAAERGDRKKARQLRREIEELERKLEGLAEREEEEEGEEPSLEEELEHIRREREEIMRELMEMKKHLEELRRLEERIMRELKRRDK